MEHIQPYLDYFTANPEWAIAIVFLIAFGEALLIIGLFVPSTAVLVGAGMLVGTGHLGFWPVFIATCVGAIIGDQLSYWAGRLFGDRLKTMWPLNRYQALVAKGEDFVRSHGGKSIAIGRFVPGVKAVVPGIVGMLNMSQPFFIFVNVTSGIFWGAAHVFPGILLGQGLAFAGELSGRLALLLLLLIVVLGALGWVARLLAAGILSPFLRRTQSLLANFAKSRGSRPFARLGRALSPEHPKASRLLTLGLLNIFGLAIVVFLSVRILNLGVASNLDLSVHSLLSELRNAPADALMVIISMLGSPKLMALLCAAMALWLVWFKAWRAALAVMAALGIQQLLTLILKVAIARPRPIDVDPSMMENVFSFPSGHAAAATLAFGLLAIISGHSMGRWSKAVIVAMACMLVFLVGFSRVYLGVHWMTDVMGGIALSAIIVATFGFILEAYPARRIRPLGLIGFCFISWMTAGSLFIDHNLPHEQHALNGIERLTQYSEAEWSNTQWRKAPQQRVDLMGGAKDPFFMQWIGPLDILRTEIEATGFKVEPNWQWSRALQYADPHAPFTMQPPRPLLHEGLMAKLTAVLNSNDQTTGPENRHVVRVFKTKDVVKLPSGVEPVYLINVLQEINSPRLSLFSLPRSKDIGNDAVIATLLERLSSNPNVKQIINNIEPTGPRAVFAVK